MAKSKCEQQLDQMRQERDHWRKVAQDNAAQLADAKRALERMGDMASALASSGGIAEKYQIQRDGLIQERDQAVRGIRELEFMLEEMGNAGESVANSWAEAYDQADEKLFSFPDSRSYMPALSRLIGYSIDWVVEEAGEIYDNRRDLILAGAALHDPHLPQKLAIERIIRHAQFAALYHLGIYFKAWAWGKSQDPALLATDILEQWARGEDIEALTVYALCESWPDAPANPDVILVALDTVRKARKLAHQYTQAGAASKLKIGERTLRRYEDHVAAIENLAKRAPTNQGE